MKYLHKSSVIMVLYLLLCASFLLTSFPGIADSQVIKRVKPIPSPNAATPAPTPAPASQTHVYNRVPIFDHNVLVEGKDGRLYLLFKNSLYVKANESGDQWGRIIEKVISFAVDPSNENVFYTIHTEKSVQKSMDRGKTWLSINNGIPQNAGLFRVIINPHNTSEVYALSKGGLFKTADAGFTWQRAGTGSEVVNELLIDPKESSVYYARTARGLLISKDAGTTWKNIDNTLPKVTIKKGRTAEKIPDIAIPIGFIVLDKAALLVITSEHGILRSEDNGITWKDANAGCKVVEHGIGTLLTDDSGTYISSNGYIYKWSKESAKWDQIAIHKDDKYVRPIGGIYRLKDGNGYVIVENREKIIYIDNTGNKIGLNYGVMPHSTITNIKSANINGIHHLFAFLENYGAVDIDTFGLFYSTDNGKKWQKSAITNKGISKIYISPYKSNEMWLFVMDYSWAPNVFHEAVTYDGGSTWMNPNKFRSSRPSCMAFHPTDPNVHYICLGNVFRYDTRTGNTINLNVKSSSLLLSKDNPNKMLADTQLSLDGGWTWKDISQIIKPQLIDATIEPIYFENSNIVIASKGKNKLVVFESLDMGNNWNIVGSKENNKVHLFYVNPVDNNNIFVVTDNAKYGNNNPLILVDESNDKGRTWNTIYSYRPAANEYDYTLYEIINAIMVTNSDRGKVIYIGGKYGLKRSYDCGINWETLGGIQ